MIARLHSLRRDQGGFTLVELLVSMAVGMVVLGSALALMDSGARSSTRTQDRVEVSQRGRVVMTSIQRRLRSQVCVDDNTPPIAYGDGSLIMYYEDSDGDPYFTPQAHWLYIDPTAKGGRGAIVEYVYTPDQTASQGPPWTYNNQAPKVNVLAEDVTTTPGKPFLTYYAWDAPNTPMSVPLSQTVAGDSIPDNSMAKVVRIDVNFRLLPGRSTNSTGPPTGTQNDANRDNDFTSTVYVRNTDYTDTEDDNRVWGPRCG